MSPVPPFLKWAGGKRWLADHEAFTLLANRGTYIEPFLGSAAIYFSRQPEKAILSDTNYRLIETYKAIKQDWKLVVKFLTDFGRFHSKERYYSVRSAYYDHHAQRAAQFLYLNRTCWNGLYRENLLGQFNVPIGTKTAVIYPSDNFEGVSQRLQGADLICGDFEASIDRAAAGDVIFADPPYTTAHNLNGFVKYNEMIFTWQDQVRLASTIRKALTRGATALITNADHESIRQLYEGWAQLQVVYRHSIIAANSKARKATSELLIICSPHEVALKQCQ